MDIQPRHQLSRLNPFVLPANTHSRFILLIISLLGASFFIYQSLFNAFSRSEFQRLVLRCGIDKSCLETYEQLQAVSMIVCVGALIITALIVYWLTPLLIIRRWRLRPISADDDPELLNYLMELCQKAELSQTPIFLLEVTNPHVRGLAFGRLGRYCILLSAGLTTKYYTNRRTFRAVVLHELAHIKNADIDETYYAVAVLYVFLFVAFIPFMAGLFLEVISFGLVELGFVVNIAWRGIFLSILVLLLRNAVLRAREFHADVQATLWDNSTEAVAEALASFPPSKNTWKDVWRMHPQPEKRRQALTETHRLLDIGVLESIATGAAVAVAYDHVKAWLMLLIPYDQENYAFWLAALIFAPLIMGILGLGIWRSIFASLARHKTPHGIGRMGIGFGLGLVGGQFLSFRTALWASSTPTSFPDVLSSFLLNSVWGMVLMASLYLFLRWVANSASIWIETVSNSYTLRRISTIGLLVATSLFVIILGTAFFVKDILDVFIQTLIATPMTVIWMLCNSPLFIPFVVTLWAFPLAAWFWRKRSGNTLEWAFLDSMPKTVFQSHPPLHPGKATFLGLAGGVLFCVLMSILLTILHLILPDSVRSTTEAKNIFLKSVFFLAILLQLVAALASVAWIKRVGWAHGLLSAFIASCVMTIGFVGLLQMGYCFSLFSFGPGHTCAERVDIETTVFFSQYIIKMGSFIVTPITIGLSAILSLYRNTQS